MNSQEIERRLATIELEQQRLRNELADARQREAENVTVFYEHTQAYFKSDVGRWCARWNSSPYGAKWIKTCGSKQEAVNLADLYNEIAKFVVQQRQ